MKKIIYLFAFFAFIFQAYSQFDIEDYKEYLETHTDMTLEELLLEYPAGKFYDSAPNNFFDALYADSVIQKYNLTDHEIFLLNKNSFMVSDRLDYYTFIHAYWDIYIKDLPVYISADAILHALHYSFGYLLKETEKRYLSTQLGYAVNFLHKYTENFPLNIDSDEYQKALRDFDIYTTVTRCLLVPDLPSPIFFEENYTEVKNILSYIDGKSPVKHNLFSETLREIDYSQFTIRGHYADDWYLKTYFRAMMWLGRTEILLTNPENSPMYNHSKSDIKRMTILSAMIAEAAFESGAEPYLQRIEETLSYFLGSQDNISIWDIHEIMDDMQITSSDLIDDSTLDIFREKVLALSSANQHYNSQILYSDITSPEKVEPPSVFLMMGQRPIIDGFITANVVFDKVLFEGQKVKRMVPKTLDILFALGNDASVQLLDKEIEKYHYAPNLAALRYLIEGYEDDFWESSTYTSWLSSIKSLNPPVERDSLPLFMQTSAWWQKTMNTQLASWAELRHDFLLYAKQPYTLSYECSYPHGFVEPVPELFANIRKFWEGLLELPPWQKRANYISEHWISTCSKLEKMAEKCRTNQSFTEDEINFFQDMITTQGAVCSPSKIGWYPKLYYEFSFLKMQEYIEKKDASTEQDKFTVADVHTIPMDETGMDVGWVLHAGTGRPNLAVINTKLSSGENCAFVGPVYSYYEFISNDFKRLTDQEWREMNGSSPAERPDFTRYYMADENGNPYEGEETTLYLKYHTGIEDDKPISTSKLKVTATPNPFSNVVLFKFNITKEMADKYSEFKIFDLNGNLVKSIINGHLYSNNYSLIWDGTDELGQQLAQGTYIYSFQVGNEFVSDKITLIK